MKKLLGTVLLVALTTVPALAGEIDIGGIINSPPSGFAWIFNGIWQLLSI